MPLTTVAACLGRDFTDYQTDGIHDPPRGHWKGKTRARRGQDEGEERAKRGRREGILCIAWLCILRMIPCIRSVKGDFTRFLYSGIIAI